VGLGGGLLVAMLARPPDILVAVRADLAAVRTADGGLAISPWARDKFVSERWLRLAGRDAAAPWPATGAEGDARLRCDALGCIVGGDGRRVALTRVPEALEEDCILADLVISFVSDEPCSTATPLIGRRSLARGQGLAVRIDEDGVVVETVRESRGERPWVR
jgi:competence protein ComEC